MNERMARMDMGLFAAVLLMLGFGIVLVYSSSFALAQQRFGGAEIYLGRQAVRALLAVISFTLFINIDYHVWGRLGKLLFVIAIIILITVLVIPNNAINGAKRWLPLGPLSFQVSDFARMALVVLLARMCQESGDSIKNWKVLARHLAVIGVICGLIVIEPDFSIASMIGIVGLSMLFMAGARFWHLSALALAALPVCLLLVMKTPYRRARVMEYLQLSERKADLGYQAYQSLIGLGNGGIFGVGLGKGEQKYFYLPEPHTDFIFSILGEEIGFIGLLIIVSVFGFIIYRGMKTAMNAPDKMGQLMAFGFTLIIAIYAVLHAFVCSGVVPTTGVPMPFLSYGGASLVFTMSAMGILLNISTQCRPRIDPAVATGFAKKSRMKKSLHERLEE